MIRLLLLGWAAEGMVGIGALAGIALTWLWSDEWRHTLDAQATAVQAQWEALATAQRLNAGFMVARDAMRVEAMRGWRDSGNK